MGKMKNTACASRVCLGAVGFALLMGTGCQTWIGGMTLPSGHYLEHPPQYFPPSPPFPLSRELASQEAVYAAPATAATGLPAPVPPVPAPDVPPPPVPMP
jgi:hypothetical protein